MKATMKETHVDALLNVLIQAEDITTSIRVDKSAAKRWMVEDRSILRYGNRHYLAIKELGLGVCMVKLRPLRKVGTYVVKEFEAHSIPSEFPGGLPTVKA
jgi:hypothetical protein